MAVLFSGTAFVDADTRRDTDTSFRLTGTTQPEDSMSRSPGSSYLLSDRNIFAGYEGPWTGFLSGMRATTNMSDKFADNVGNPIYFESPFIETNMKLFYAWHDFPSNGQIGGGQLNAWAAQIRVALSDRLAFIATKDGYTEFNAGILPRASGWNDFAIGLKYAFIVDETNDFVLTGGLRWEIHQGSRDILQGGDAGANELNPFISIAKKWDWLNFTGTIGGRIPMDHNDGNHILYWDLHFDTEIAPETLPGFYPLFELHAIHYLSNADRFPVDFGGLDYTNLGSSDVGGSSVFWGDLGFRWKLTPNLSFGAAYGFPISNPGNDIFNQRVTVDLILSF